MPQGIKKADAAELTIPTTKKVDIATVAPGAFMHPSQLEYLRVTSLKTFELCPYTWAYKYLRQGDIQEEERTGAAAIGTAAHSICEDLLMQIYAGSDATDTTEHWKLIPDEEASNVHSYLKSLTELPIVNPLVVEERLYYPAMPDTPPISGQIDLAGDTADGDLLIVDHKTNRKYQNAEWWRQQLQQLFYAWMARKEWPGRNRYLFRIGYVNLGTFVQWETNPDDDNALMERFENIWSMMLEYASTNNWPMRVNDECGWCQFKDECPEKSNAIMKFSQSFKDRVGNKGIGEQLQYVKDVEKIVKALRTKLESALKAEIQASGAPIIEGDTMWSLETSYSRKAEFIPTLDAINAFAAANPQFKAELAKLADDIFTVKVGGLDKAAIVAPGFKSIVEGLTVRRPAESETIVSKPIKKVITDGKG